MQILTDKHLSYFSFSIVLADIIAWWHSGVLNIPQLINTPAVSRAAEFWLGFEVIDSISVGYATLGKIVWFIFTLVLIVVFARSNRPFKRTLIALLAYLLMFLSVLVYLFLFARTP